MVVIPSSNPRVEWSIDKAKSAIVAVFFLERESDEILRSQMRTTQIQSAVEKWFGHIWPVTFSRALADLRDKGTIATETRGKEKWNSLVLPEDRDQLISVYADVDGAIVKMSSSLGAIGDVLEGWSFYGIPKSLKSRLRVELRAEARQHSERIDEILEKEYESYIQELMTKAKGHLNSRDLKKAETGLWELYSIVSVSGQFAKAMLGGMKLLERIAPEISTIEFRPEWGFPDKTEGRITYLSNAFRIPRDEVEKAYSETEKDVNDVRKLFDLLTPGVKKRLAIRLNDLWSVRSSIVSVVK